MPPALNLTPEEKIIHEKELSHIRYLRRKQDPIRCEKYGLIYRAPDEPIVEPKYRFCSSCNKSILKSNWKVHTNCNLHKKKALLAEKSTQIT
jgi:hypothetical protein